MKLNKLKNRVLQSLYFASKQRISARDMLHDIVQMDDFLDGNMKKLRKSIKNNEKKRKTPDKT